MYRIPNISAKENYEEILKCLRKVGTKQKMSSIEVLIILEKHKKFRGIRKWFVDMDKKYREYKIGKRGNNSRAGQLVENMSVLVTGARSGEVLSGKRTQALDAIIQISDNFVPPSRQDLDTIRQFPDLYSKFISKLGSIDFFLHLSTYEREIYLYETQSDKDIYLQDVPDLKIQVFNIGTEKLTSTGTVKERSKFLDLDGEQIEKITTEPISATSLQAMFPFAPGSKGIKGRSTLIFRRSLWTIVVTHQEVRQYIGKGILLRKTEAILKKKLEAEKTETIYVIEGFEGEIDSLAILTQRRGELNLKSSMEMVLSIHQEYTWEDIKNIQDAMYSFTPAGYKSLLQKIIRFRPHKINMKSKTYPSDFVLSVVFAILLNSPGFVPDLQRHVKGPEAALKRLVVILFEDSYFPEEFVPKILALLTGALLSQRIPVWKPSKDLISSSLSLAKMGLLEDRNFSFNLKRGQQIPKYTLESAENELELIPVLLEEIKSLKGDHHMVRDIISQKMKYVQNDIRPKVMPLEHCVDQHWVPEMVYFAPLSMIYSLKETGSKPFSYIMWQIFRKVTGINPRRPRVQHKEYYTEDFENRPFVKKVRKMQKLLLLSRQISPTERKLSEKDEYYDFDFVLDKSWIAGMLGAVEVKVGKAPILVTLRPDSPDIFVAVRKPYRGMKSALLTEEQENKAIEQVKTKMKYGYPLNKVGAPIPELENAVLIRKDGEYWIRRKNVIKEVKWEDFRKSSIEVCYLEESLPLTLENGLRYTGFGQEKDAYDKLRTLIKKFEPPILRRLLAKLAGYKKIIEFERISRDGGAGNKAMVVSEDVGVYHFICYLTILFPEAISRMKYSTLKFMVGFGPLLWKVRQFIQDELEEKAEYDMKKWGTIKDREKRKLFLHQKESVDEMENSHRLGRTGHFLYMAVGMGKCHARNTPILMWNGTIKMVQDIKKGELICGDDSTPRTVLSLSSGVEKMYRVVPVKGDSYIVNKSHILSLKFSGNRGWKYHSSSGKYQVTWWEHEKMKRRTRLVPSEEEARKFSKSLREISPDVVDMKLTDYLSLKKGDQKQMKGFRAPVEWDSISVPIDPYIFGLWLGDGSSHEALITNVDDEILHAIKKWCDREGYSMNQRKSDSISYGITGGFHTLLKKLGVIQNKHVPLNYKRNSIATRLSVLAGLIDADGYVVCGCYEITQKSKVLTDDILYLARSCGFAAYSKKVIKSCTYKGKKRDGWYWRTFISGNLSQIPVRVKRKVIPPRRQKKNHLVTGITIEEMEEGEYFGFTLDGNSRYLLGDFTVTHNTLIVFTYIRWLWKNNFLPPYIIYSLPPSAIDTILREAEMMGLRCKLLVSTKTISARLKPYQDIIIKGCIPQPYHVNLVLHDHLRNCETELSSYMPESIFVMDEVHKALNKTLRTSAALQFSRLSREMIALTGTPVIDTQTYKLNNWLEQIVPFEVNEKNFWTAANGMVAKRAATGIRIKVKEIPGVLTFTEEKDYHSFVPPRLGGKNANFDLSDLNKAFKISLDASTRKMVELVEKLISKGERVFILAYNYEHQKKIHNLVKKFVSPKLIFLIGKEGYIDLTDESVERGKVPDYKIVITTMTHVAGYNLSRLTTMVSSVYPSNEADREQAEGRVNRIGQKRGKTLTEEEIEKGVPPRKPLIYHVVYSGIQLYMYENQKDARNLSEVFSSLADETSFMI